MFTKRRRGRPSSSASFFTRAVPTSSPMTPLTTTSAPSTTRRAQRDFALEARIAGDVEQVDLAALPGGVREGERDRHPALLLVLVPVADRRARLDRAEPVHLSGLVEQGLDERGLAGTAVSDDGDVADLSGLGQAMVSSSGWDSGDSLVPSYRGNVGMRRYACVAGSTRIGRLPIRAVPCDALSATPQARSVSAGSRMPPERRALRRSTAFVCSCETRDSVTPSTSPISRSVSSS